MDRTNRSAPSAPRLQARYVLFAAVAAVLALGAAHQPQHLAGRPSDDAEVLARVPARSDPEVRQLEQLRLSAERAPADLSKSLAVAQSYIEASRKEGDPRLLGAAEAALTHWTVLPDPPPEVRLLRATILQSRHEFDAALQDLDRVLADRPDDAQAWLTRATVWTVKGNYDEARASCEKLVPLVSATYVIACVAPIDGLTGHGTDARAALERALASARLPVEQAWLHSLAGEQALWLGDATAAESHLRAALALDPSDRYSRAVYADLLLDNARASEVSELLHAYAADDALALRSVLAELAQGTDDSSQLERVEQSFAASRQRGDSVHRREEARLRLARGDSSGALRCAEESWAVQHEPWDARLVLEAALASHQVARARSVFAWLDATHFEAPVLGALRRRLETQR